MQQMSVIQCGVSKNAFCHQHYQANKPDTILFLEKPFSIFNFPTVFTPIFLALFKKATLIKLHVINMHFHINVFM